MQIITPQGAIRLTVLSQVRLAHLLLGFRWMPESVLAGSAAPEMRGESAGMEWAVVPWRA